MIQKKLLRSKILITSTLLLGGCNFFPEPASLIQSPQQNLASGQSTKSLYQNVKKFIPTGSSLTVPNDPVSSSSIIQADFNGDGENEAVTFYKSNVTANKVGAVVLHEEEKQWSPLVNFSGNGYEISWGSATDIDGDGIPELLIGWKTGVSAGNVLDIYKWSDNHFVKITQLNYHELELIESQAQFRLAIWKREFDDVYKVDVVKWNQGTFVSDKALYPSYFLKVSDYFQQRAKAVPDAAHYWYYLADSLVKAKQPESALHAINKGMTLSTVVPPFNQYDELKKTIETQIESRGNQDVQYYVPYADLTINIPEQLAPMISIQDQEGVSNEYIVNVYITDQKKKGLLFSIEIHSKDFISKEELPFPIILETEHLMYMIRLSSENPFIEDQDSLLYKTFNQASNVMNDISASIRLGAPFPKHVNTEDTLLTNQITEAYRQITHVNIGGELKSETLETFTYQQKEYRFLGEDINTREKLIDYLSNSFTTDAIQDYIDTAGIIEHNKRLAQPNADGGSLLTYPKASVIQARDLGSEKQYDLRVPLANSLSFEVIHISFRKTEAGWKISSSPLAL